MQRSCVQCGTSFTIDQNDIAFLSKVSPTFGDTTCNIPPPTHCPTCRLIRRLCFRNQYYVRTTPSATTGKPIFSMYYGAQKFPVLDKSEWWGDTWDATSFGRPYNPNRSFFEQFRDLRDSVPMPSISTVNMENCDYCNNASSCKDCYLVFNATGAESCMYGDAPWYSRDCIDITRAIKCELCYDCVHCENCYGLQSSDHCNECLDSYYLSNCRSCSNCFGCVNLRRKQYYIFNEPQTKEDYFKFIAQFNFASHSTRAKLAQQFKQFATSHPRPHQYTSRAENISGNYIYNSRNVHDSYIVSEAENIRYGYMLYQGARDCQDVSLIGLNLELAYESSVVGIDSYGMRFCYWGWPGSNNLTYCALCPSSKNLFGCVGLKKKEFCILNQQYTEDEYNALVPEIIEKMDRAGEWGEFFPATFSPFPYNVGLASLHFPLKKEEALARGLAWSDIESVSASNSIPASSLPDELPATDDPLIVRGDHSDRPFKITSEEIRRYRDFNVPLPRAPFDERIAARWERRCGMELFERKCEKTGKVLRCAYPPSDNTIIWDRDEYEKEFG